MNIGAASRASGVSAKMIRYYEETGLIPPPDRTAGGYRDYTQDDLQRLSFVRRARDLGFSIETIQELLGLWSRRRSNAEVRALAQRHVDNLQSQARKLEAMIDTLQQLIGTCKRGKRTDCPIMSELAGVDSASGPPPRRARQAARGRSSIPSMT
jgi:Cu(I)-responsive transcriptional regulator